jgi:hypothetical protein
MENVRISTNVNFLERGILCAHLYKDAIRLSSEGVSVLAADIKRTLLGKGPSSFVRYSRKIHLQKPNFRNLNNRPGVHRTNQDSNFNSANLDFDIAAAIQRTFNM